MFGFSVLSTYCERTPLFLVWGEGQGAQHNFTQTEPGGAAKPLSCSARHSRSLPEAPVLGPAFRPVWTHEGAIVLWVTSFCCLQGEEQTWSWVRSAHPACPSTLEQRCSHWALGSGAALKSSTPVPCPKGRGLRPGEGLKGSRKPRRCS